MCHQTVIGGRPRPDIHRTRPPHAFVSSFSGTVLKRGAALALACLPACLLGPVAAHADTDTQAWGGFTVNAKIDDHWRASNETILRTGNARLL
jgi:hypothetical protein